MPISDEHAGVTKRPKPRTVSHTLDAIMADKLRKLAFVERVSESSVIELALNDLFSSEEDDASRSTRIREGGYGLRRKPRYASSTEP